MNIWKHKWLLFKANSKEKLINKFSVESLEPKGNVNQALQAAYTAEVWTLLLVLIP